uniref:Uncharacterized protein n=1 Tax=Oryza punctata TaxID=4537 RepID=A0A0E0LTL7_ORYPU
MTDLVAVSAPICSSPPFLYQNRRPVITQSGCGLARPWSHRRSTLSPRRTPPAALKYWKFTNSPVDVRFVWVSA